MNMLWPVIAILVSLAAFGVAAYFYQWVSKLPTANQKLEDIGLLVRNGAFSFLRKEYRILAAFMGCVAAIIFLCFPKFIGQGSVLENLGMALAYIFGTVASAFAGWIGISIATIANIKAATAATEGIKPSFLAGFRGGAVMGMAVVGTSLMGAAIMYLITGDDSLVLPFSFGASSLALFAKAGGGIFTKAADIAADLVGKVEFGFEEDDPRNPAVIADNVGDNVGDVAGMGADLFDSNVAAIAAAMVIAMGAGRIDMIFCYGALGLLASIIGVLCSRVGKKENISATLNNGTYLTCALFTVFSLIATVVSGFPMAIWGSCIIGMGVGVLIGVSSDFFTGDDRQPVKMVAKACEAGPAFTILTGFSYGLISAFPALVGIGLAALISYNLAGMLGISMAAIGMLSIVGMITSNDAYGPIVDNARGLAEMGGLGGKVLDITDELDSAGNTAKAITKGFAIGAAGLTVISLLGAFQEIVARQWEALGITESFVFDLMNPTVFFGMLVGASVPAVFSAMLIMGVDRNAQRLVGEIHRQFTSIPGLKEGKEGVLPDYNACIDIATVGAIKELIPAGLVAILTTLVVGFVGGVHAVGGFLTGNITIGLLLAMLMSNAGGLWDNAKKYIESGHNGGKGSPAHKAAVIGDTVGDPFKDTSGPSINTQITVVSLVASLAAVLFVQFSIF
ncbi:sodium-translocating pyrophosphatase [Oscillospiraceae bacterium MB08-C2-2]|nr:sodium-translocating pyrophosphatase [Oscillospiraceae bacterium MB08-C2-2]